MNDIKAAVAKRRKVALYARMDSHNWYAIWEVEYTDRDEHFTKLPDGELRERPMPGYVRITEPVEVEFAAINEDVVMQNAVASLDAEERKVLQEMNAKVADIRERKKQLLALTYQPAAA